MLKNKAYFAAAASAFALALGACGDGAPDGAQTVETPDPAAAGPEQGDALNTLPEPDPGEETADVDTPGPLDSPAAMAPVEDYGEPGARADFEFGGASGGSGTAWFFESAEGVRAYVLTRGMASGTHAIHVHETGDCSASDFTSAGEHLGVEAGQVLPDKPDDFEAGLLPDIVIGEDGAGELNAVLEVVRLTEDTDRTWPLFDADGSAIVIHRFATGELPAGEDNPRIACAEIYPSDL